MKALISAIIVGLMFAVTPPADANSKKTKKSARANIQSKTAKRVQPAKPASDALSTDVKFDDSTLHGQYQTPDEALAKVENEKSLQNLLGVRKHYKDRLKIASEQE